MKRRVEFKVGLTIAALSCAMFGCAQLVPLDQNASCQAAAARLSACGAIVPSSMGVSCDPLMAEQLLELSCDEMGDLVATGTFHASADFIPKHRRGGKNGFACWLGFNFACPEPACVPDPRVPTPSESEPCAAYLQYDGCGLCEYYRCRERSAQCGQDAYLEGFVGRYCDRFATVTEPRVSPRAAQWLKDVRQCLVSELEWRTDAQSTCDEIEEVGIDSHAYCYVENGFCDLSLGDWFSIVHTIDPFDVPFRQVLVTGNQCLRTWFGGR